MLIAAAAAYSLGVIWRIHYILIAHPATDYVYSDMKGYVDRAIRSLNPNDVSSIADTVIPPGTHLFLAGLYRIDPSWTVALVVQMLLSVLVPLIIGMLAFELFGLRVAMVSIVMASLYFPFIDYAGYFLSENPYLFAIATSMLMLVRSLRSNANGSVLTYAFVAGLALGAAASLKSVILLPALLIAVYLEAFAWKYRIRKILPVLIAVSAGLVLLLIPLAERCYRLNENRFCLIDNNFGFNVLMGHYGHFGGATWVDAQRGMTHVFGSPVNAQRALQNNVTFNFGVYDAPRALQEAWQWSTNHAVEAVLLSIEHVFDLFVGSIPWPSSATRFNGLANLYQQIYLVFILLPACIYLWGHARPMMRMDQSSVGSALLLLPLLGLMIAAFLTIGEPRYRIPYDGFTIIFAACAYVNRYVEPQSIVVQGEGRDGR